MNEILHETSQRCLYHAYKWAAEQLPKQETILKITINPHYEVAKSYFQLKEYSHCFEYLNKHGSKTNQLHVFLRLYSFYMAGEKNVVSANTTRWHSIDDSSSKTINPNLSKIESELSEKYPQLDSYLLFLYAIVCKGLKIHDKATEALIKSVNLNPWNWSAWLELESLVTCTTELNKIILLLPVDHVMTICFQIKISIESDLYPLQAVLQFISDAEKTLVDSLWLQNQKALIYYNYRDYDEAEQIMTELQKIDPLNLDIVDVFSNVLYVKQKSAELSILANHVFSFDRFRAESCIVIGNYYSLREEREKAITYFQRALKLDPQYLAAWTLLGHEYLELKSWNSAIFAYRRAVDISAKDYRAWFGLGQAYELLQMPHYAIYYIQKAAALKPYDGRMWQALGNVYKNLSKQSNALTCYKRSLTGNEVFDPSILASIGKLYSEMKNHGKEAATWFQLFMEDGRGTETDIEFACKFLCGYYMQLLDLKNANKYLLEISHTSEGKIIQRELKSLEKNQSLKNTFKNNEIDWL